MSAPVYLYVGVSLIVIIVLAILLTSCENKSCSPFTNKPCSAYPLIVDDNNVMPCVCSGSYPLKQVHGTSKMSYNNGNTEYQSFAEKQKAQGGPKWKTSLY